ncbi:P-loop containing nucleoside triphosphate hydrolase protein [Obelidium mucronatum]|nr:P-loop containing nucleoside triphosphate hydrolase protein [Obelidium mucronatum]
MTSNAVLNVLERTPESLNAGLTLAWKDLGYTIKDKASNESRAVLDGITGTLNPGEVLAVLGPSGAGNGEYLLLKDVIAGRKAGTTKGRVLLNGTERPMKKYSSYVTQDDSLIGCFTVRETLRWAVELNLPAMSNSDKDHKVQDLLTQFGLVKCANSAIGDPFSRGISGGEKRRLSIAVQLVKEPKVIFLDEPTSGLDSSASFNVMETIKTLARRNQCPVVCSIHQPSPSTYRLFDKVLFLVRGETVYFGKNDGTEVEYFKKIGYEIPMYMNIPDAVLDSINVDFLGNEQEASNRISNFITFWNSSAERGIYIHTSLLGHVLILTRRNFSNAIKNILLFWVRMALYVAMAVLMGTTWWQLDLTQNSVQPRFMAVFLSVGFLAFMSAAGIPAILEDRQVFYRERMNRSYSVAAYVISNTIISMPFVFLLSLGFSLPLYFMAGLHSGADRFFIFTTFMWLTLYVAESVTVLIAAVFPNFVVSLTLAALFNGVSMVTHGFLVRENIPSFWKYGFTSWNYQKWAWRAFVGNEFDGLEFRCDKVNNGNSPCYCAIPSSLEPESCSFTGLDVLKNYGYDDFSYWKSGVCLVAIIVGFRIAFYIALRIRKPKV